MHAQKQTQTPGLASNACGSYRMTAALAHPQCPYDIHPRAKHRPTRFAAMGGLPRQRSTHNVSARDDIHPSAKKTVKPLRRDKGDSLAARRVSVATADRGETALAHAGMHAHSQTQTPAPT